MYFITTIMDTDEITNNVLLNITAGLNELNEEINYIRIKDVHPVASSFLAILGEFNGKNFCSYNSNVTADESPIDFLSTILKNTLDDKKLNVIYNSATEAIQHSNKMYSMMFSQLDHILYSCQKVEEIIRKYSGTDVVENKLKPVYGETIRKITICTYPLSSLEVLKQDALLSFTDDIINKLDLKNLRTFLDYKRSEFKRDSKQLVVNQVS
jgi:hypothetical protein